MEGKVEDRDRAFFSSSFSDHVFQKESNPVGAAGYRINVIITPPCWFHFTPYCGRSSEDLIREPEDGRKRD